MNWWQTLIVALSTYAVTKIVDFCIAFLTEKRDFKKYRRNRAYEEIDELKNSVGSLYELTINWKSYDEKQKSYISSFENDHELIGKYNKYPSIANAARDTIHWCKIVAFCEKTYVDDVIKNKKELAEKYMLFLRTCDEYIDSLA